jgi:hypothetical protein
MKMKSNFLLAILCLFFANTLAETTITCKKTILDGQPACDFSDVAIGPNEAVSIKTDPSTLDANSVKSVGFWSSTIHSIPAEVFTKFPNVKWLWARGQKIQEIKADLFVNAKNLEIISLDGNALTVLHKDTFKGKFFRILIFFL